MTSEIELNPRSQSRLKIIQDIINNYDGLLPFHHYLRNVFRSHKSFGSTDRKIYRSWCYAWYRLGNALAELKFDERLFIASYSTNGITDVLSEDLARKYFGFFETENFNESLDSRIKKVNELYPEFKVEQILNELPELSANVTLNEYALAMLRQPEVYIRINSVHMDDVISDLKLNKIPFQKLKIPENCISISPGTKLEQLSSAGKKYFEIQDKTSQLIACKIPAKENNYIWDCCCGAGGKSLALIDRVNKIQLLATDKRNSVLTNFKNRLPEKYSSSVELLQLDLNGPLSPEIKSACFDGIIADVPCTGSGTWSRTPENLPGFREESLSLYQENQKQILNRVMPFLKPDGWLIYITCSVFKDENEDIVDWAVHQLGLKLKESNLINGFVSNSDSMFYAIFKQ